MSLYGQHGLRDYPIKTIKTIKTIEIIEADLREFVTQAVGEASTLNGDPIRSLEIVDEILEKVDRLYGKTICLRK